MRLILVLAVFILAPAYPAGAQSLLEAPVPRGTYDTNGQAFGIEAIGSNVLVSDHDAGIIALDAADPDAPLRILSRNTPSFARNSAFADSILLVADRFSGLRIYRWNGSNAMALRSAIDTPGLALSVDHHEGLAVVADKGSGLQIVDYLSQPTASIIGAIDTPGFATDVAVQDGIAFVADFESGVRIISLDDPTLPVEIGAIGTPGEASGIVVHDGLAYVADGTRGLRIIDVTDPTAPSLRGFLDTTGTANELALAGDWVLMASGTAGLQVIDVSNPAQPALEWSWPTTSAAFHVAAIGECAALALGGDGVALVQVFEGTVTAAPSARRNAPVLVGNSPNPFNPTTTIRFVPANDRQPVELSVFDLRGRRVRQLARGVMPAVEQTVTWDGRDDANRSVASGVYVCALEQGGLRVSRQMVLIK